jgi:hypothetical protein
MVLLVLLRLRHRHAKDQHGLRPKETVAVMVIVIVAVSIAVGTLLLGALRSLVLFALRLVAVSSLRQHRTSTIVRLWWFSSPSQSIVKKYPVETRSRTSLPSHGKPSSYLPCKDVVRRRMPKTKRPAGFRGNDSGLRS